jgi:hypothetical protein
MSSIYTYSEYVAVLRSESLHWASEVCEVCNVCEACDICEVCEIGDVCMSNAATAEVSDFLMFLRNELFEVLPSEVMEVGDVQRETSPWPYHVITSDLVAEERCELLEKVESTDGSQHTTGVNGPPDLLERVDYIEASIGPLFFSRVGSRALVPTRLSSPDIAMIS